jgi:hypothetical protein
MALFYSLRPTYIKRINKQARDHRALTILVVFIGLVLIGLVLDLKQQTNKWIYEAEAKEVEEVQEVEKVVQIEVKIEWTKERIEQEIRAMFPEAPNTAVAIAKCESGLNPTIRAKAILHYGQEESYGLFQVHARDWNSRAIKLGYTDYKTDVIDNIKMARHIYEGRGSFKDWSCYNNGGYKRYL